jgi:hypothetical protein
MYSLSQEQTSFLTWVNRNYEWLKTKGFEPSIIAFQHWNYKILLDGNYTEEDREHINYTIKFIKGRLGLTTYNKDWTWDKHGAEMDWLVNVKSAGFIKTPRGNWGTTAIGTI